MVRIKELAAFLHFPYHVLKERSLIHGSDTGMSIQHLFKQGGSGAGKSNDEYGRFGS
jgi:hypothetical protein